MLVVDPDEIDAERDDIKIIALGTYLMMGPGNIIIAVNMSKHVQNSNPQKGKKNLDDSHELILFILCSF